MLITLKMLLRTLLLPPTSLLLLAACGALLLRARALHPARRRLGWGLLAASLAALWLLATPALADLLERAAERCPPLDPAGPPPAQAIVILGGGEYRIGAPEYGAASAGVGMLERLSYGAYLARRTGLPVVLSGTEREVIAMRATLARDYGIAVRWVDDRSRDTFQNAAFSARLLQAQHLTRILLVTSASHEYRAVQEFTAAGFEVVPAPAGSWAPPQRGALYYVPSAQGMARASEALYELLGVPARAVLAATHLRRQAP